MIAIVLSSGAELAGRGSEVVFIIKIRCREYRICAAIRTGHTTRVEWPIDRSLLATHEIASDIDGVKNACSRGRLGKRRYLRGDAPDPYSTRRMYPRRYSLSGIVIKTGWSGG